MGDIKWAEPPESNRGGPNGGAVHTFVEALKTRPGEWAQYAPERAHTLTQAAKMKQRYPGLETTMRVRPDRRYDVYARWVGNGDGHG